MVRLVSLALIALAAVPAPAAPPEVAPQPRDVTDPLADWTPRPATGKAEPWEKATDPDWVDARFREMNTGPALNCTMRYPLGKGQEIVYKATVVKLGEKGDAGVVFDRSTMRLAAAWTGGYLNHSDRRFGLLNTPTPKGEMIFTNPARAGWGSPADTLDPKGAVGTAPLPGDWARYRGMYLVGHQGVLRYSVGKADVLDSSRIESIGGTSCVVRTLRIDPAGQTDTAVVGRLPARANGEVRAGQVQFINCSRPDNGLVVFAAVCDPRDARLHADAGGEVRLTFLKNKGVRTVRLIYANDPNIAEQKFFEALGTLGPTTDLDALTKGGPRRWGEPIVTKLVRGDESGPFAVDTLTIPYKNRFNALFFCTGVDFLPDGRVAVCTCHGDVWLVTVDEKAATCSWQRYATGLYHPLGLKVVDGKVVVLERGQLTRLHDLNADGEADFYECVSNDWHTGAGEHSYDTCLETDPHGNFYFFKTGDTHLPTGGCLMRVSRDGSKAEVFATGFRHPIGMGMSPTGILTGGDQEGNWMPATRIDEYRRGGFYGDMRGHHRKEPPKTFDPPLCWLPREVDNSAGGQVWVPKGEPGASATGGWANSPLAGLPLHLSYGRCRPFVLLRQECEGLTQGGVAALDVKFLSGVCRGRFAPDGHLYVCGLNGWQTAAQADGCLQRVRYTGQPLDVPVTMAVDGNAIRLTFSRALDAKSVANATNYKAAWWNYRWSGEYGSKRWKVSDANAEGQDEFGPRSAKLLADGKTVELEFEKLRPVMQMQVGYNVAAADGGKVVGSVFLTIHSTGK